MGTARIALSGGAYTARSVIAAAQRSVNLYAEPIPAYMGEPARSTDYPTPGTRLLGTIGTGPIRAIRQASNGQLFVVSGSSVYLVNLANWTGVRLGDISPGLTTPASMTDNGDTLVIVDGTNDGGWTVDLTTDNAFAKLVDPGPLFHGADKVDYLDTFFVFNRPGTTNFFWSLSQSTSFDPEGLDIGGKAGAVDRVVTLIVAKREIWVIGHLTTEVRYDVGATDTGAGSSQFARVPGVFVDHGTVAKYSVASDDNGAFWLTRDRQGAGFVVEGANYSTERISTYAIETEFKTYARIDDAVGFCYQLNGHSFYVLSFPTADKSWVYDKTTKLWHEWVWLDSNGTEHRHRANCVWPYQASGPSDFAGTLVAGDWQNGNLYALDPEVFTDNGFPIMRVRSFPHVLNEGKRVFFRELLVDIDAGIGPDANDINMLSLDFSDDRGHSYGNPIMQSLGALGEYVTSVQFQRLGMARDRVFRLSWSAAAPIALQGGWLTVEVADADAAPAEAPS